MADFLTIQQQRFSYDAIRSGTFAQQNLDTYAMATLNFCKDWLNGQSTFTIHTSGSTGIPKPINLTRDQMQASAQMTGKALQLTKGDRSYICLNTSYIAGVMMLVRGFELGMQMTIVPPSSNPLDFWQQVSKLSSDQAFPAFDFTALVPMQIQNLLTQPNGMQWLNAMKAIIVGGAPVNYTLEQQIQQLTSAVYITYGMTETVTHIALKRLNGAARSDYYTLLPEVEIKQDERQCLQIKSPTTLHKWITTNDLVVLSGKNRFQWLGRIDRVINSGGVKIQAEKVEKILEQVLVQQGIQVRFFVVGQADERLGEKVIALLETPTLRPSKKQVILTAMKKLLSPYEVPKGVYFVAKFAETSTAKIDRIRTLEYLQ